MVLYDKDSALAEQFGLQFELPDSHKALLNALNVDLEALTGNNCYTFSDTTTYVVDGDGKIKWAFVPNNYRKRAELDDILSALKSL